MTRLPLAVLSLAVIAAVNLGTAVVMADQGNDPFGYLNAAFLAIIWMFVMLRG